MQFYVLFLSRKLLTHTFLLQIQSTHTFCCKNDLSTLVLLQKQFTHTFFVAKTIYTLYLSREMVYAHFFVAKTIYALFCHKKNLCTLFLSRTRFTRFFAKTIYASRPESFCALKVAIRIVQTFWVSDSAPDKVLLIHSSSFYSEGTLVGAKIQSCDI